MRVRTVLSRKLPKDYNPMSMPLNFYKEFLIKNEDKDDK